MEFCHYQTRVGGGCSKHTPGTREKKTGLRGILKKESWGQYRQAFPPLSFTGPQLVLFKLLHFSKDRQFNRKLLLEAWFRSSLCLQCNLSSMFRRILKVSLRSPTMNASVQGSVMCPSQSVKPLRLQKAQCNGFTFQNTTISSLESRSLFWEDCTPGRETH